MKISTYFNVVLIIGDIVSNEDGPEVNVVIGVEKLPEMSDFRVFFKALS